MRAPKSSWEWRGASQPWWLLSPSHHAAEDTSRLTGQENKMLGFELLECQSRKAVLELLERGIFGSGIFELCMDRVCRHFSM